MRHLTVGSGDHCVLGIHGIQGTCQSWVPVAEACESKVTFILPNLRGRGNAFRGTAPDDYSQPAFADEVHRIIQQDLDNTPYVLAGWSMGVSVLLEYLLREDAIRPQGLILLSGSPTPALTTWFWAKGGELLEEIAEREQRLGLKTAADHDAVAWSWEGCQLIDHRSELGRLDIPTLILHGSADDDTPVAHASWLAEGLPNAELIVFEGSGHSLLAERTVQVAEVMDKFMGSLPGIKEAV